MEDPTKDATLPEGEAPQSPVPAKAVAEAAEKPEGEAAEGQVKTDPKPQAKSYSEDEWRKAQSAWGKEKTTLETRLKEVESLHQTLVSQTEEAKLASWLQQIEGQGNADIASSARQVVEAQRAIAKQAREFAEKERRITETESQVKEGMKVLAAHELVKAHKLEDAALAKLLEARDPVEMEKIALQIRVDKYEAERNPAKKTDQGAGTGKKLDWTKMPFSERLGRAIELSKE